MSDLSYMWLVLKPSSGLTPALLLEAWEPVSIDVQEMSEPDTYSVLFSTRKPGQFFYTWQESICSGLLIPDTHLGRECSP